MISDIYANITFFLSLRHRFRCADICVELCHETSRAFFPPGSLSLLHAFGIGKALLSTFEPSRIDWIFKGRELERFTDKTVGSLPRLREEIAATRDRGYAIDDQERTTGMRCVAAPILNVHGEAVAAISVSGPTHRVTDGRIREIGEQVRRSAATVSRLSARPHDLIASAGLVRLPDRILPRDRSTPGGQDDDLVRPDRLVDVARAADPLQPTGRRGRSAACRRTDGLGRGRIGSVTRDEGEGGGRPVAHDVPIPCRAGHADECPFGAAVPGA